MVKKIKILTLIFICYLIFFILVVGGGFGTKENKFILNNGNPIAFAHKGISNYYAENSMEGYKASRKIGFTAIEADVKSTRDKGLVIFHDQYCKRLLGIDSDIEDINLADVLKMNLIFENEKTKNKVLSLDQFLEMTKASDAIYLDIKRSTISVADSLLCILEKHNLYDKILIADDKFTFLAYLKFYEPKIKTVLEEFNSNKKWSYYFMPKNFKPDFYSCELTDFDEEYLKFLEAKKLLKSKIVYGVNHNNIGKVKEYRLDQVIIDYDSLLGKYIEIEQSLQIMSN